MPQDPRGDAFSSSLNHASETATSYNGASEASVAKGEVSVEFESLGAISEIGGSSREATSSSELMSDVGKVFGNGSSVGEECKASSDPEHSSSWALGRGEAVCR